VVLGSVCQREGWWRRRTMILLGQLLRRGRCTFTAPAPFRMSRWCRRRVYGTELPGAANSENQHGDEAKSCDTEEKCSAATRKPLALVSNTLGSRVASTNCKAKPGPATAGERNAAGARYKLCPLACCSEFRKSHELRPAFTDAEISTAGACIAFFAGNAMLLRHIASFV